MCLVMRDTLHVITTADAQQHAFENASNPSYVCLAGNINCHLASYPIKYNFRWSGCR